MKAICKKELTLYGFKFEVGKALDNLNHGTAMVMHLPYGGLPLVSVTSKEGEVTIC